jgi:predicted transcriptional regulator
MICVTRPKTTRESVAEYFTRMPDEALMVCDVIAKFGVTQKTANRVLLSMQEAGELKRETVRANGQLAYEYSAAA